MSGARTQRGLSRRQVVQGAGAVGLGLLVGCGRWPWQGPPQAPVHRMGYLGVSSPAGLVFVEAFKEGLRELGYVEGQNILAEYRLTEQRVDHLSEAANELVRLRADVIVTRAELATFAAKQATDSIPIVFTNVNDPVELGLVASLARPGGNVTGLSTLAALINGKRLELLREAVPTISRVAVFWNAANPAQESSVRDAQDTGRALGLQLYSLGVRTPDDLESAFHRAIEEHAEGLLVLPATPVRYLAQIVEFAAQQQLPAMYNARQYVEAGGLMAYDPDYTAMNRRAAYYVDRIFKGARPADLPVEQPREFDFVINRRTAQALGLTIPHHVLLQATEVIQ
jgi:putative tryptophan/tyrosine transport system substrate-binding protein